VERWVEVDRRDTGDGTYELRRRGDELLIVLDGRVLMNSRASRSEQALAELALAARPSARRVLVGGLGMGITLRRALQLVPGDARVQVVELQPHVAEWCRGPLSRVNARALADPRVALRVADVAEAMREAASGDERWDAILLDLFEGPHAGTTADDPCYGDDAVAAARRALAPGGVLAVWGEDPAPGFERRLEVHGFAVERRRPGRGGRRHAVTLAVRGDA